MKRKALAAGILCAILAAAPAWAQQTGDTVPEEKKIQTDDGKIRINFPEMDIEAVMKNFAEITGKSFILEQVPKGQIRTIGPIGPVEISKDQAFNLFVLIMSMNGYNVVPTSIKGVYKVIRTADAMRENIPVYGPGQRPPVNEATVTRFVQLDYLSAQDVATQLGQLASKEGGQVIAYPPTNTLIMVDTALNIERMLKIIRLLDVPSAEPEMEIIRLKYLGAEEASAILSQIYSGAGSVPAPRTATTRQIPTRGRRGQPAPVPAAQGAPAAAAPEAEIKIIPLERLNSLLIIAEPDVMASIKDLISKIDVEAGGASTIHVYYVQNAEASELAGTLSGLGGSRSSGMSTTASTRSSRRTSAAGASPMGNIPVPTPQPTAAARSYGGTGPGILDGMFGGEVSITSDEPTNALIIVATPQDYAVLLDVIKKLDLPRRQVFVEAVLLEVTYQESKSGGVSWHAASGLEGDGMILGGTNLSSVSSMSLLSSLLATSSGSLPLPNGVTVGALGRPVEIPGSEGQLMIPSAGMVVQLLASESNVNVLSTPTLLTTDNEEASIEVGQKIPVPTGQTVSTGGFSNVSISRESVGIKLKLTPQINESDNIRLEIFTEISGAVSSGLGIDVNTLGVTTSLKTAETVVIVRDSQTIVIGGLMEDRQDMSESKIPLLGDIPILGWLFKSANKGKNKTNLIILLTPHIVKSDDDIERVKGHIKEGYVDMMEESLGTTNPPGLPYFDSQLRRPDAEVIDLTGEEPVVVEQPEWGWEEPRPEPPTVEIIRDEPAGETPSPEITGPAPGDTAEETPPTEPPAAEPPAAEPVEPPAPPTRPSRSATTRDTSP